MTLLGNANWWLPGWLDRLLPGSRNEIGLPDPTRGRTVDKSLRALSRSAPETAEVTGNGLRSLLARVVAKEMHKSVLSGLHQLRSRLGS